MLKTNFAAKQLNLDAFEEEFFESNFCKVAIYKEHKVLLSETYRVPNTSENFLDFFAQKMSLVNTLSYSMLMLGTDQKLDLLNLSQHQSK